MFGLSAGQWLFGKKVHIQFHWVWQAKIKICKLLPMIC